MSQIGNMLENNLYKSARFLSLLTIKYYLFIQDVPSESFKKTVKNWKKIFWMKRNRNCFGFLIGMFRVDSTGFIRNLLAIFWQNILDFLGFFIHTKLGWNQFSHAYLDSTEPALEIQMVGEFLLKSEIGRPKPKYLVWIRLLWCLLFLWRLCEF